MVALQQPLHTVHDPRMDEFLRRGLQPHLHLRVISLRIGRERQRPNFDEKSRHRRLQRPSSAVHTLPCFHLVLSNWQSPTDQNRENYEQTLASPTGQHCSPADYFLCRNSDTHVEVAPDAESCASTRNPLGHIFRGRFHCCIPSSHLDLRGRNRLPVRSLACHKWRSHQRHPNPSPYRDSILVRDRRRIPVSWNIPVPVDPYRTRFSACKKSARSNWVSDNHRRGPGYGHLSAPV